MSFSIDSSNEFWNDFERSHPLENLTSGFSKNLNFLFYSINLKADLDL